ncbi:DUF5681 domain-containing protein [Tsuneonella sp. SYSU-LHT278]|uniref:DUF5681 domain-containing protein n=1 Tax=Tsuneonella sediminis TaxID=3416089 RepID=UPI003F7B2B4E
MSRRGDTRFVKGRSGNPAGRPKKRRPHVSAFDIVFDKTLTVTQGGKERELTIEEALELQTYQAALKGSKMAIRKVLKMIEKREVALAKMSPAPVRSMRVVHEYSSDNLRDALLILGIAEHDPKWSEKTDQSLRIATWATQAGLSRPGRRKYTDREVSDIKFFTLDADALRWPRGSSA